MGNDNVRIAAAATVGALLGGVAGYLFLTARGRTALREIEPAVDEIRRELISLGKSMQGASGVAREGWKLLQDLIEEDRDGGRRASVTH